MKTPFYFADLAVEFCLSWSLRLDEEVAVWVQAVNRVCRVGTSLFPFESCEPLKLIFSEQKLYILAVSRMSTFVIGARKWKISSFDLHFEEFCEADSVVNMIATSKGKDYLICVSSIQYIKADAAILAFVRAVRLF